MKKSDMTLDILMARHVMKWKEGKGLAGGGCRPADAKPYPKNPPTGCYAGCEMGSTGGTFPYTYYGTLFRNKKGCGELWKPSERIEQAMEVVAALEMSFYLKRCQKTKRYLAQFGMYYSTAEAMAEESEDSAAARAICRAAAKVVDKSRR